MRYVFLGYGDQQIAREQEISVPTARTHFGRLFGRLDVQDRCELIPCFLINVALVFGRKYL